MRAGIVILAAGMGLATATAAPAPGSTEQWVVESSGYSGPRGGGGVHRVTCVPQADLALPRAERETWREIRVDEDVAYAVEQGDACPEGPIVADVRP